MRVNKEFKQNLEGKAKVTKLYFSKHEIIEIIGSLSGQLNHKKASDYYIKERCADNSFYKFLLWGGRE